jgi:hypothetical protein
MIARRSDACPTKIILSRHSSLIERTNRSACAFKFGDIGGSRITPIPVTSSRSLNRSEYLASRSMMR